jgi:hypothetical protein
MVLSSARRPVLVGAVAVVAFGIVAVTGACGARPVATIADPVIVPQSVPTTTVSVQPAPAPAPAPQETPAGGGNKTQPIDAKPLVAAAASVEPNTTLAAVVFDRTTGQELLSYDADRQFRSASLVKLLIAIDMLNRGADSGDRHKIARMLSMSDDDIASLLWVQDGGPALVKRAAALIGLQGTEPPEVSGKWGEVKLTAHDIVRVYQYVMDSLPPADHTLIVDALAQAPEYAADGFRQHFGIPDGLNLQWAIKQGWGNNDSAMVLHSTGLVGAHWRFVVVLLTEHPLGSGWKTSAASVTAAAQALNGQLPGA